MRRNVPHGSIGRSSPRIVSWPSFEATLGKRCGINAISQRNMIVF